MPWAVLAADKAPGGQGAIVSALWQNNCLPGSGPVVQVCFNYRINWKMWTLMGEPVGDYNLSWTLGGITVMDPKRRVRSELLNIRPLPDNLRKGIDSIELYIDAMAAVSGPGNAFHHFDTGAEVRAGKVTSVNTPGSPNWNDVFISGAAWPHCDNPQAAHLAPEQAKKIFNAGFTLGLAELCKKSSVSVDGLVSAIGDLCGQRGASRKYGFCPLQDDAKPEEAAGPAVDLDEDAQRPQVLRRLEEERARYRPTAQRLCRQKLGAVERCYAQSDCRAATSGPSEDACRAIPPRPAGGGSGFGLHFTREAQPGEVCYVVDAECLAERERNEREAEDKRQAEAERLLASQQQWDLRHAGDLERCRAADAQRQAYAGCQARFKAACNPQGLGDENACVEAEIRSSGPTEQGVLAQLKKEWAAKARQPATVDRKDAAPSNFLD